MMSERTDGSAFSFIVTPAVVCGTKTTAKPLSTPDPFTISATFPVISINAHFLGVDTENVSIMLLRARVAFIPRPAASIISAARSHKAEVAVILDDIVAWKRTEVEARRKAMPLARLEKNARSHVARPFEGSLVNENRLSVLAEIKRASPSAGLIREEADAAALAASMEGAGADALSVLTDRKYFAGSLEDMAAARGATEIPVLEKDFVIDEYQVWEAAAWGADAVLLIVRVLDDTRMKDLYQLAKGLSLGCLVEVHTWRDLNRALTIEPPLLGINNRDLTTFTVDIATTLEMMPALPESVSVVSQSGISTPQEALKLFDAGVKAIQVGESLMRASDPGAKIGELLSLIH